MTVPPLGRHPDVVACAAAHDRSYDGLWLTVNAHLHVLETRATTDVEQAVLPHLVLGRLELTDDGKRQPVTGGTVSPGYRTAVGRAEHSPLGFTDRVRFVAASLRQLEGLADNLTEALCAGRSGLHIREALALLTNAEHPHW